MSIHDEAEIWSFQMFQALKNSYKELNRKDNEVSYDWQWLGNLFYKIQLIM